MGPPETWTRKQHGSSKAEKTTLSAERNGQAWRGGAVSARLPGLQSGGTFLAMRLSTHWKTSSPGDFLLNGRQDIKSYRPEGQHAHARLAVASMCFQCFQKRMPRSQCGRRGSQLPAYDPELEFFVQCGDSSQAKCFSLRRYEGRWRVSR